MYTVHPKDTNLLTGIICSLSLFFFDGYSSGPQTFLINTLNVLFKISFAFFLGFIHFYFLKNFIYLNK